MCWGYSTILLVECSKAQLSSMATFPSSLCLSSPKHVQLCSNLGSEGAKAWFETLSSLPDLTNLFLLIYKFVLDHYAVLE